MKITVISLKCSERRKNFDRLFSDFRYQYYDAIQPQENDIRFDQFIAKTLYARELRKGEVGCTLSHFEAIKEFARGEDESSWLLIMEDDALPEKKFNEFINTFSIEYEKSSDKPEILLLGHSKTSKNHLFTQSLKQPLYMKGNVAGIRFGQNPRITLCGTVSYLINKEAARIISRCARPYWMADDWRLFSNLGVAIKHPVTPLIFEDLSYSSSTDNEVRYHHDFWDRPLSTLIEIVTCRYRYYKDLRKVLK